MQFKDDGSVDESFFIFLTVSSVIDLRNAQSSSSLLKNIRKFGFCENPRAWWKGETRYSITDDIVITLIAIKVLN